MADHESKDSLKVSDDVRRRRPLRLLALAGVMGFALAFVLALSLDIWPFRSWRGEERGDYRSSGLLADYVPEDSAAVIAVNFRQLLESSIGKQHLRMWLQQLLARSARQLPWLEMTGIKPADDIDTLLISFPSAGGGESLLLARGRFAPSRFQVGADFSEQKKLDSFRVWEYHNRAAKETTWLAAAGDMVVISQTRTRVQTALKQVREPQPISVRDGRLRELLTKGDRQQSLWLAASVKELGPASGIDNYLLRMMLRPLLAHAECVYGGITCSEDIRAELHFSTGTEEDAAQLEADLKSMCEAAPGVALLGRQSEFLPLLRLLGASQIHREGKSILLHSRLRPDQIDG
jgi:hypothetical protein